MAEVIIELNSAGIQELLKSPEIASVCESAAEKMTVAAGVKYKPRVRIGKTRVRVGAYKKAGKDEQKICPKCGQWHPNCTCKG